MMTPDGLTALETACALVFGADPSTARRSRRESRRRTDHGAPPPAVALTDGVASALRRPPCLVAFSGGRDSSLLLAAGMAAARREGLPAPVPVTVRFPGAPASDESEWQERVVAHLCVDDWLRIEIPEGLDVIGPVARRVLTGLGLMYPPNAHIVMPMLDHAAGGTVVAGLGGDELFGLWERRRLADVAARRDRPRVADVGHLVEACVPPRARLAVARRPAESEALPWLRPAAQAELDRTLAEQHAYSTRRWDRHVRAAPRARSLTMALRHFRRIAATAEAEFRAPLLEPAFCESLARVGGWRGFGGRTATLRALFSGLLPDAVLARRQKAIFNDAFFTAETRRFATEWSGDGLDPAVVDPVALREAWTAPMLDYRSSLLLQSAWLHDRGGVRS